jgi:hypothetical protein
VVVVGRGHGVNEACGARMGKEIAEGRSLTELPNFPNERN